MCMHVACQDSCLNYTCTSKFVGIVPSLGLTGSAVLVFLCVPERDDKRQ
jgi:hypothetical protein